MVGVIRNRRKGRRNWRRDSIGAESMDMNGVWLIGLQTGRMEIDREIRAIKEDGGVAGSRDELDSYNDDSLTIRWNLIFPAENCSIDCQRSVPKQKRHLMGREGDTMLRQENRRALQGPSVNHAAKIRGC